MSSSMWITFAYAIVSVVLFVYSFTQVDLNLTISSVGIWQGIQKFFQNIGYYERPLSTGIYLGIIIVLFAFYSLLLRLVKKGEVNEKGLWKIIWVTTAVLLFSYPAFSHDIFNYMFTAKTVLVYHKNPYEVIPLQFAGVEPWVMFMRWVHLPSAYTPLWIALSLPAYIMGFGYFLLVLWNIKILVTIFYLWSIWLIGKILEQEDSKIKTLGMAIFALNPLIIIETLVSGHNDIVMMALALFAYLLYIRKNIFSSWFALATSIGMKLMTIMLAPIFILKLPRIWMLIAMLVGLLVVISQREFLPWYWVWIMPFVALIPANKKITTLATGVSFGLLLRYTPYLYLGNYDPPVPSIRVVLMWIPIVISAVLVWKNKK